MLNVDIKISRNLITPALKKIRKEVLGLPAELHAKMVDLTPKDTGHARNSTRLVNNKRIQAAYAYAQVLNRGRHRTNRGWAGSNQAPEGMTKPLRIWYRQRVRQLLAQAKRR